MGEFEKYIARSFYFWMVRFLRTKYNNVQIVFISHHTEAKEVTEEEFFHKGESGGTQVSSAYELALQIIQERYNRMTGISIPSTSPMAITCRGIMIAACSWSIS